MKKSWSNVIKIKSCTLEVSNWNNSLGKYIFLNKIMVLFFFSHHPPNPPTKRKITSWTSRCIKKCRIHSLYVFKQCSKTPLQNCPKIPQHTEKKPHPKLELYTKKTPSAVNDQRLAILAVHLSYICASCLWQQTKSGSDPSSHLTKQE